MPCSNTCRVAQGVVDVLESLEVDENDRGAAVVAGRDVQGALET
jgi:hypothetical protein